MKKKIVILITSDLYLRNYLETNVFKKLINSYECFFVVCSKSVLDKKRLKKILKNNKIYYLRYSFLEFEKFQKYLHKSFLINNENSKTVNFLGKNILKLKLYWIGESSISTIIKFPIRFLLYLKKNLEYLWFKINKKNIFKKKINPFISKILNKVSPDLIIYPLQGPHLLTYEFLKVNSKVKTLGLIDNWDNLSSRPAHNLKPDYISVWGHQTKKHAIKFQNYKKKNIFILGTPRFKNYFINRNQNLKSNFKFKYILFLESFYNYDNLTLLKKLDFFIENTDVFKGFKIIYRPHPWQKNNWTSVNEKDFKNLVIDPQLKKNYLKRNFSTSFQPNLNYYSSLIKNSEIIITGPTSMLIEATIFYKKILLLGYKNRSEIPYSEELTNYEHFAGIERFKNVNILKYEKDFLKKLVTLSKLKIDRKKIDELRNIYLDSTSKYYDKELYKITKNLLNE